MTARDHRLTLTLWALVVGATVVGLASLWRAGRLARRRWPWQLGRVVALLVAFLAFAGGGVLSYARTEGGDAWAAARWNAIAPADWRLPEDAEERRHVTRGGPLALLALAPIGLTGEPLVARPPPDWLDHDAARGTFFDEWCARKQPFGLCTQAEDAHGEAFADDWEVRRRATLANLDALDLRGRDLREATLLQAFLPATDLRGARLEGAELSNAEFAGSLLSSADFTGTALNQSQLDGAIGDGRTILPRDAETGAALYVWSCWEEPPPTLEQTLALHPETFFDHAELRADWLCQGRPRLPVFSFAGNSLP